jgi:hypothetical protein
MAQREFGQANPDCRDGRDSDYKPWARGLGHQACSEPQAGVFLIQLLSNDVQFLISLVISVAVAIYKGRCIKSVTWACATVMGI